MELNHIGTVKIIENLTQEQQKPSSELPKIYGLSRLAPYVNPTLTPNEIIKDIFTFEERENFVQIISTKQKTNADWDAIRAKLPEDFLHKIRVLTDKCWENGFCNPHISEGELRWSQIKGKPYKYQEQCDLCKKSFSSGMCKGSKKYSPNKFNEFKKCWEVV